MENVGPRVSGPIQALLFRLGTRLLGPLARLDRFDSLSRRIARAMARLTLWANRARPSGNLSGVATEWDRMFRESFPESHLTTIGEVEAEGEITAPCPLGFAGSENLRACDRRWSTTERSCGGWEERSTWWRARQRPAYADAGSRSA